jgi:Thioredoxin like C-terminal domain
MDVVTPSRQTTPETYIGTDRADRTQWVGGAPNPTITHYAGARADELNASQFALQGPWRIDGEHAVAGHGATLKADVQARRAYLVLSPGDNRSRRLDVLVDGKPYRTITVTAQKLYTLVDLPQARTFYLTLRFQPGLSGFAFTFG